MPGPRPRPGGGGGLGATDKVKCDEGAKAWIAETSAKFNTFVDGAKSNKAHLSKGFFSYAYGSGDLGLEEHREGETLAEALAPLRLRLVAAIKANKPRKDGALERAVAALGAYEEGGGEEEEKKKEVERKRKEEAEEHKRQTEAVRMSVTVFLDGLETALPDAAAVSKFLSCVAITPRPQTLEELKDRLVPMGRDRAKELCREAMDLCKGRGEERVVGERKGMAQLMKAVQGAKSALETMGVQELGRMETAAMAELTTAASALQQQYTEPWDSHVATTGKMSFLSVARLVPLLPRGVTARYPDATPLAVMLFDAELQCLPPGDPLRGSIRTIVGMADTLGGLQGTLVCAVTQRFVLDMMVKGLSPAVTLAAWQSGLSRGAAAAMATLPTDTAGGRALMSRLMMDVRAKEGAGRHSISLGGSGMLEEGVQAVLAQRVVDSMADMVADAAAFSSLCQERSDTNGAPRGGRPRGQVTAAPYSFMLWKALCCLAAGTAVFALSEQVANAVGGAGMLTYTPAVSLYAGAAQAGAKAEGKRSREPDYSEDEASAGGAGAQAKAEKPRGKKKERKKARTGASGGNAQAQSAAQGAAGGESSEGEGAAGERVPAREGFPMWDFFKRYPAKSRYWRKECGGRCCYCGSASCAFGAECPVGFPKESLQAREGRYDPQAKSRAELASLYAAMKSKHQR